MTATSSRKKLTHNDFADLPNSIMMDRWFTHDSVLLSLGRCTRRPVPPRPNAILGCCACVDNSCMALDPQLSSACSQKLENESDVGPLCFHPKRGKPIAKSRCSLRSDRTCPVAASPWPDQYSRSRLNISSPKVRGGFLISLPNINGNCLTTDIVQKPTRTNSRQVLRFQDFP